MAKERFLFILGPPFAAIAFIGRCSMIAADFVVAALVWPFEILFDLFVSAYQYTADLAVSGLAMIVQSTNADYGRLSNSFRKRSLLLKEYVAGAFSNPCLTSMRC